METIEEIDRLVGIAVRERLEGVDWLLSLDRKTIQESYNGIGPAFLSASLRSLVTKLFGTLAPAAVIHDLRNEFSDGSKEKFHEANWEFLVNCLKLIEAEYPDGGLKKRSAQRIAFVFFLFVDGDPGWRAWNEAKENHEKKIASGNSAGGNKE